MHWLRCIFCNARPSSSKRMNDKPADYQFICHTCRKQEAPDELRCTYVNEAKGKRCGHWKGYKSERCKFHDGEKYK